MNRLNELTLLMEKLEDLIFHKKLEPNKISQADRIIEKINNRLEKIEFVDENSATEEDFDLLKFYYSEEDEDDSQFISSYKKSYVDFGDYSLDYQ